MAMTSSVQAPGSGSSTGGLAIGQPGKARATGPTPAVASKVALLPTKSVAKKTGADTKTPQADGVRSMTLAEIRETKKITQQRLAGSLGIKQANISKLESRGDALVSTLAEYLQVMGGSLEIRARFGDEVIDIRLEETRGKKRPRQKADDATLKG